MHLDFFAHLPEQLLNSQHVPHVSGLLEELQLFFFSSFLAANPRFGVHKLLRHVFGSHALAGGINRSVQERFQTSATF